MILLVRFTLGFMLVFMAFFLIALVLIQRGRGGGLAGAFGGAGGQSAFGTKAGDLFTRITVVAAAIWIILCILATNVLGTKQSRLSPALGAAAGEAVPAETGDGTTADAEATEMEPAESEITEEPETGTEAEPAVETEPAAEPAAE
ncbi:MAG: preprotein translocase subunit SecG [Planctomycetota bacterium]|jgi:preprotein translocase subunit SecG|nr:preprotein translocase subunit SecG [Planctomycetota bacterium]